ncbi:TolC family protein [Undibacterium sp. Rencai35W]|uniref:TolC family protein n=1 Tax=Undibacterium sp. Rencai35W TaxID=3413046 RepID=UPI003BF2677B
MTLFIPQANYGCSFVVGLAALIVASAACADAGTPLSSPFDSSAVSSNANNIDIPPTFGQLTLAQALQLALNNNRDIKLSRIAIDNAAAVKTAAGATPNPMLTLQTIGINPKLGIGTGTLRDKAVDTTLRLDQLIERGGKRELRLLNASHLERSAKFDNKDQIRQIKLATSFAYFDLMASQHKLRIANEVRDLFQVTLAAAEKRKKSGDIAGADTARIRVDALRAENDSRQAAADLLHAQANLIILFGLRIDPARVIAVDEWTSTTAINLLSSTTEMEEIILKRPDVMSAQAKFDAALAARKLALAAKSRDVSVGLQVEHYPVNQTNQLGSGNSLGISIQIPLFTRYEFQGEIRIAEANVDSAGEMLEKTKDAASNDIALIVETARTAQELLQRFQTDLLKAARYSADAAEFAFKNGATGVMDVLDARRTYRVTEIDAINAHAEFSKALAALRISTQE